MPHASLLDNNTNGQDTFALSSLQQAYLFGRQRSFDLHVATHTYFEFALPRLNTEILEQCFNRLIAQYDGLRAVVTDNGELQVLHTVPHFKIPLADLSELPEKSASEQLQATRQRFKRCDMDFSTWPCFAICISRLPRQDHVHMNFSPMFTDGLSVSRLLHELSCLYIDPQQQLSQPVFSFAQYVQHREANKTSKGYQKAREYWWRRLTDLPPGPELPLATGRDQPQRSGLNRRRRVIEAEVWRTIKARADKLGLKNTALMFTLFACVLAHWSKSKHFVVTMLIQRRDKQVPGSEQAIASFASTVLVEFNFDSPLGLLERIKGVQKQLFLDLMHAQICGLELMQQRNRSRHTIASAGYPVAFVSNLDTNLDYDWSKDYFHRNGTHLVDSNLETPQVYLDHQLAETQQQELAINWDAMDDVLYPGVADAMLNTYESIIRELASHGADWQQPVCFPAEKQLASILQHNTTPCVNHQTPLLHELFFNKVASQMHRPAITTGARVIGYQQLAMISSSIATEIELAGIQANHVVGVFMHKDWQQIAAVLGISASGAAYVPIDPELPAARISYLLDRCEIDILVTQAEYAERDEIQHLKRVIVVSDATSASDTIYNAAHDAKQRIQDLAYIIFTSGSTGQPKGVMLNHQGPCNTVLDINAKFAVTETDRVFAISALNFDLSVYDVFGTLAAGGTIVLPEHEHRREPDHWLKLLHEEKVTIWNSAPALMQMLVEFAQHTGRRLPESLRLIMLSGDWIPTWLPDAIRGFLPQVRIISLGGATEASIWSIYFPIEQVDNRWRSIPYGKALANQSMQVLDSELHHCPIGVTGEIYIGGVGLALGYWKDIAITQRAFIQHPLSGERLYRTGDLGRYLIDGNIEFLGREDNQIKLHGYRVELGEIETVLQQHAGVTHCVVVVTGDNKANHQLAAYIAHGQHSLTVDELQGFARARLPAYMIPAHFVLLPQLPVTNNGKIDRHSLPAISPQHNNNTDTQASHRKPDNETERALLVIWQELLHITDDISTTDSFFDLGGQSFLAVRLIARIEQQFGVELSLATLIETDSISTLAARIDNTRDGVEIYSPLVLLQRGQSAAPIFLLHPVGGNIVCYRDLARLLHGLDRPVYGLQANPDEDPSAPESLQTMAAAYIQAMQSVHAGPYCIGGWSMGGVLAFEIARQLIARGDKVDHLFMFDAPAPLDHCMPGERQRIEWFFRDLGGENVSWLHGYFATHGFDDNDESSRDSAAHHHRRLALFEHAIQHNSVAPGINAAQLQSLYLMFARNLRALREYHAQAIDAPQHTLILRAADQTIKELQAHPTVSEPDWGWRRYLGDHIGVDSIAGDHYSIFARHNLAALAQKLAAWLEQT